MNKKISLLICFLISLFFLSCNDPFKKTNVYIFDSENGHIEVSLLSEANQKITFEITAYPDEGYELLGENINNFYCMNCLADYLGTTVEDLLDKIEEFKDEGCTLFK